MTLASGYRFISTVLLGMTTVLCGGCAGLGIGTNTADDLALSPGQNQIIAWVPREQAQTASVAQAIVHVALTRAKQTTEAELCQGTWVFSGKHQQIAPTQLSTAPASLGGFSGWHVRISWEPQLDECGINAQSYARALSKHLPGWMMTQSGQPLALFHQGVALYHQDSAQQYALAAQVGY